MRPRPPQEPRNPAATDPRGTVQGSCPSHRVPGCSRPFLCIHVLYYRFAASEVAGAAFSLVELGHRVRLHDDDVSPRACDLILLRTGEI
ncbi:MAG: hypothetical protein P4L50_23460, partial [Anaerolineaceae bacterium]|nr:hypothetical protein [Anaerolineaceae bacterium]